MSSFIPGLNCDVGPNITNSTPIYQSVYLDTPGECTETDWVKPPRPCKDVLRQAIRVNRIKKGQVMPVIDKSSITPQKRRKRLEGDISEEILQRRQKNREAAKKCRLKKRMVLDTLQDKIDKYTDRNRTLENEIKNFKDEISKLQSLLREHKCRKQKNQNQHQPPDIVPGPSSSHTVAVNQHEVSATTAAEDIADSLDDLLSELQDDDRWREELMQYM